METKLFNGLKEEVTRVIAYQKDTDKTINYLNKILVGAGSNHRVFTNLSIASFQNLICNSADFGEFRELLQKINHSKFTIMTRRELVEEQYFNDTECVEDKDYQFYKDYLNNAVELNSNLYLLV